MPKIPSIPPLFTGSFADEDHSRSILRLICGTFSGQLSVKQTYLASIVSNVENNKSELWKTVTDKFSNKVDTKIKQGVLKTQKKLISIMTSSRYTKKSGPLFKSLKILNIFELKANLTAVFRYSYHHDKQPAFLDNLFKTNKSVHSYDTRSAANIHIEKQIMANVL